ncbi:MAG: helix-turn-helix transcriptional regulator [Bacteroidales bacterium]|nr:helix-turn-helix transcriptional regulator [Bacteroidales bacterium]
MNTERLKMLMQSSGLNKSQLAERCGVSRATLDNVLAGGDAKMSTAEAIARELGIRVGYLFDESSSETDGLLVEIQELRRELAKDTRPARITVEVELTPEELKAAGLTDKMIKKLRQ